MAETEDQNHTRRFIEEYRSFQLLWDANHKEYTNKIKRNDAIIVIGIKLNMDPTAVKSKIKSLRSYYSKIRQKVLKKAVNEISARNEFCTFGTFVADNVRKLKPINQILAKRQITNMLTDLQIKEIETCERQLESSETSVVTNNTDTQCFIFDESTNLAVNTVDHLT